MTAFGYQPQFGSPASRRIEEAGREYQARRVREKRAAVAAEVERWRKWNDETQAEKTRQRRERKIKRLDRAMGYIKTTGRKITMAEIVREVADKHNVSVEDIMSARRMRPVALARHEAMYRSRTETRHALTAIGRYFDRDHTTVLHACQTHAKRLKAEEQQ